MFFSPTPAILGATVVAESVLYGILFVCFSIGLYLRYVGQPKKYRFWKHPVVISSTAIFLACTVHWILILVSFLDNYVGTPKVVVTIHPATTRVANIFLLISLTVGDAVIIHRLWVIWNYKKSIVILPVLSLLALIATGIVGLFGTFENELPAWLTISMTAYWIYIMITNIYCTTLIAWRIWNVSRPSQTVSAEAKPLMVVLAVIIESAAIQAIWTIFFAITNSTGSKFLLVAIDLTPPIVGLSNALVVVRLSTTRMCGVPSSSGIVMTSPASIVGVTVSLPTTTTNDYSTYSNTSPRTTSKDLTREP